MIYNPHESTPKLSPIVGPKLGQRRRERANIDSTLACVSGDVMHGLHES